jgi:hypothetical protein
MAMIELSESMQQALDDIAGPPLRIVDPRTQLTYVLLPAEVYERVKIVLGDDDELDGVQVGRLIAEVMREDDENDPLLESYQKYKGSR